MSTAKSMATHYLNGKRQAAANAKSNTLAPAQQPRFKSSTSNLAAGKTVASSRLKSTSMTNLVGGDGDNSHRLQRPVSRNALDTIHNGMNAKYAQVQSKVLLHNIRPHAGSAQPAPGAHTKIPAAKHDTLARRSVTPHRLHQAAPATKVPSDRTVLINKIKAQQDELDKFDAERQALRQELEREKGDKTEQVQQLKQELQDKIGEHDKQNEEYHHKLLEAYELADQNRRAADTVLADMRQRDEESRKKIEELELQLAELKEFVAMKEEMSNKMFELREQIRQERERYEEQLKSLHQVFENEKINLHNTSTANRASNSNYFNRIKPSLQSTESIDKVLGDKPGRKSRQHTSEHDIYGSKLSTRMHDTARSAWKASKHFASSVITGGVALSACRKGGKQHGGATNATNATSAAMQLPPPVTTVISTQPQAPSVEFATCKVANSSQLGANAADANNNDHDDEQHTSVVEVNSVQQHPPSSNSEQPVAVVVAAVHHKQHQPQEAAPEQPDQQQQTPSSLIRVDENNKLTIVTKFNDNTCDGPSSGEQPASSSNSERSRCESSSSGRGTASDAGSAASQNGDDEHNGEPSPKQQPAPHINATAAPPATTTPSNGAEPAVRPERRHKRTSSLFKAGKVFGGSQASLNKLRSFFGATGNAAGGAVDGIKSDAQHYQQQQQLESSRIRCLELNQAIKVPSMSIDQNCNSTQHTERIHADSQPPSVERESGAPAQGVQGASEADAAGALNLKQAEAARQDNEQVHQQQVGLVA